MADPLATDYPEIVFLDRVNVMLRIRLGLRSRSDRPWMVAGGDGPERGRLAIGVPPARLGPDGAMADEDRALLGRLLGLAGPTEPDGFRVEDSYDHYIAAIDRAEGRVPRLVPEPLSWS